MWLLWLMIGSHVQCDIRTIHCLIKQLGGGVVLGPVNAACSYFLIRESRVV